MKEPKLIPRHEPEVLDAVLKKNPGKRDRVATTGVSSLTIDGVFLLSHHAYAAELEKLRHMLRSVPPGLRPTIDSIHGNSQPRPVFTVEFKSGDLNDALVIVRWLERGAGLHGGFLLVGPDFQGRIDAGGF